MLTTEKLFRGDTEFALMEKVRNAEVTPPSKFNRRVPETLDAIVMKALARDAADRYQTAAELSQALLQLLDGYRFTVAEFREFLRSMFRQDYQQEVEELEACRTAPAAGTEDLSQQTPVEIPMEAEPPSDEELAAAKQPKPAAEPPKAAAGGFWAKLKGKLKG
jgi:eukaryotic-like serine/threonine-protein kinase